jgi:hypothetical protein
VLLVTPAFSTGDRDGARPLPRLTAASVLGYSYRAACSRFRRAVVLIFDWHNDDSPSERVFAADTMCHAAVARIAEAF